MKQLFVDFRRLQKAALRSWEAMATLDGPDHEVEPRGRSSPRGSCTCTSQGGRGPGIRTTLTTQFEKTDRSTVEAVGEGIRDPFHIFRR